MSMARIYRNPAIAPAENKMEHPVVETKEVAAPATSEETRTAVLLFLHRASREERKRK
jgi:hypothetical protein